MYPLDDTIVAIASPPGGAARGILRLSGPGVRECLQACLRPDAGLPLESVGIERAQAIAGSLRLTGIASPLPCDVYLWPDGRSYTGQPVAEIHTLGSRPLLEAVVRDLCAAGARLAQPGEFTLRAFLAGRIDLTQAEAVLGVIDAADPHQLDVALGQLAGGLTGPLHRIRDALLDLLAHLEAGFDFADEDLPFITAEELTGQLDEAAEQVARLARQMDSRSEASPTARAVLVGSPNVGKSSLFNALIRKAGALVSQQPGTTRDYLTAELDLDGVTCQLIDTAGIGPGPQGQVDVAAGLDEVEQAARAVSAQQSRGAHVRILCLESTRPASDWERRQLDEIAGGAELVVLTKIDLSSTENEPCATASTEAVPSQGPMEALLASKQWHTSVHTSVHITVPTSSLTGEGIDRLRAELRDAVLAAGARGADAVVGTAVRCRESLRLAAESLRRARQVIDHRQGEELVAAEVRVALDELGKVVGAVYTDDVLDRIFSRFCIGK